MKVLSKLALGIVLAGSMTMSAHAILLTPTSATLILFGDDNGQAAIDAAIALAGYPSNEIYKNDVGSGDSGAAAAYYDTSYGDPALADEDATISWVGPLIITSNPTYFLIKDGNASPNWFYYEVFGWDGMEDVQFAGFFDDSSKATQGGISHVSIYGETGDCCDIPGVPDASSTMLLLGMALMGVEAIRRKLA